MKKLLFVGFVAFIVLFMVACDGDNSLIPLPEDNNSDNNDINTSSEANLNVYFSGTKSNTPSPAADKPTNDDPVVTELTLMVEECWVHVKCDEGDEGWQQLEVTPAAVEIVAEGALDTYIKDLPIPAGEYNQIRLFISDASVVTDQGPMGVSFSNSKEDIKLHFTVGGGDEASVFVELDLDKSLKYNSKKEPPYSLRPVLHIKKVDVDEGDDD